VPESLQKDFMDEMRYLAMRDWLLEAFYPTRPTNTAERHEEVIDNRLVYTFSHDNAQSTRSFDELTKD